MLMIWTLLFFPQRLHFIPFSSSGSIDHDEKCLGSNRCSPAIDILTVVQPRFQPLTVTRRPQAFNNPDWIIELKHDGFRTLAYVEHGRCRLISRNGTSSNRLGRSTS